MNPRSVGALVGLNLALLAAIVLTTLASPRPAEAQLGQPRARYVMVAGHVAGRENQAMVYIMEVSSGRLAAVFFNSSNNDLSVMATREIAGDIP